MLGGRSLDREAAAVAATCWPPDDLDDARQRLTHLVGRDTSALDEARGRARRDRVGRREHLRRRGRPAGAGAPSPGVPGLLGYRAANTLDAMVGHRSPRYERFGWAAARLDDLLNLPGSRLTAALAAAARRRPAAALAGLAPRRRPATRARTPVRSRRRSPARSGVRLGGVNVYARPGRAPARARRRAAAGSARHLPRPDAGAAGRRGGAAVAVAHRAATQSAAASTSVTVATPGGRRRPAYDDDRDAERGGGLHLRPGVARRRSPW